MKLKTPPQSEELTSKIVCKPASSFGSTTNAKRRGRTLTVAFSIKPFMALLHILADDYSSASSRGG